MFYVKLYRVNMTNDVVKITPNPPSDDALPAKIRIIAGEGKVITKDGINLYPCKDERIIDNIEQTVASWYEVDEPMEYKEEGQAII